MKKKTTNKRNILFSWVLNPRPARRDRFMGTLNHHNTYLMTRTGSTLDILSLKLWIFRGLFIEGAARASPPPNPGVASKFAMGWAHYIVPKSFKWKKLITMLRNFYTVIHDLKLTRSSWNIKINKMKIKK